MASCLDFAEEVTALQHIGNELGVSVIISPKFHAELAGKGIEYSWGVTKGIYQHQPLNSKRGKGAFKGLVTECTSRDVLRTATVLKLSRGARAYICAYYSLDESTKNNNHDKTTPTTLTLPLIEHILVNAIDGVQNPQGCTWLRCRLREWICTFIRARRMSSE
jgi:hypothetical protein